MIADRYRFRCPVCSKTFEYDQPGEPMCTGPSEMRHEHEATVMLLAAIHYREVGPQYSAARAEGTLLLPGDQFFSRYYGREARRALNTETP